MARKTWGQWENTIVQPKEGGQGRVYFVVDQSGQFPGTWALKELKNPKRKDRFHREIIAIEKIGSHPNIIKMVDFAVFEEGEARPYYVMETADASLAEKIETLRGDYSDIFNVFEQICLGVKCLHDNGILHRDLKPENILFVGDEVKVSDMGLCLIAELERFTPESEAVGPRFYMAPELEDGANVDVDERADIYSLGKILYYLLSGGAVFAREKKIQGLSKTLSDERFDIFGSFFQNTVNESRHSRFANINEMMGAFMECVGKFDEHPRTKLFAKYNNPVDSFLQNPSGFVHSNKQEIVEQIAKMLEAAKIELDATALQFISKKISSDRLSWFFERLQTCKVTEAQKTAIAKNLFSSYDTAGHMMILRHRFEKLLLELAIFALNTKDVKVLTNIVKNSMIWSRFPEIAKLLSLNIDILDKPQYTNVLVFLANNDFKGKLSFYRAEFAKKKYNLLEFEAIIAGIAACDEDEAVGVLIEITNDIVEQEQLEATLRAMVYTKSAVKKIPAVIASSANKAIVRYLSVLKDLPAKL